MKVSLDIEEFKRTLLRRLRPTAAKMQQVADAANRQIRDRFTSGGATGGAAWPPGRMPGGHSPPLAGLQETFTASAEYAEAKVSSNNFLTLVHHLGTQGKGGALPDIVPTQAKALYIPLTEVGRLAYEAHTQRAPVVRTVYAGISRIEKSSFSSSSFVGVHEAVYGRDYIFAKIVRLPPRPQLPISDAERAALAAITAQALKG